MRAQNVDRYEELRRTLENLPPVKGITPVDIIGIPAPIDQLLRTLIRKNAMTVQQVAEYLELTVDQARHVGDHLAHKGYLVAETPDSQEADPGQDTDAPPAEHDQVYRIYYARMRRQNIPSQLF
jgi:hypothetical protein